MMDSFLLLLKNIVKPKSEIFSNIIFLRFTIKLWFIIKRGVRRWVLNLVGWKYEKFKENKKIDLRRRGGKK